MREMISMVVVLTLLSVVSGGSLALVREKTKDRIETAILVNEKAPAILSILSGVDNDPLNDRFKLSDEGVERDFFVGVKNRQSSLLVFESVGRGGYGGDIGLMIGVNTETDEIIGVSVTTHTETPGLGARAKTDPSFVNQFRGMVLRGQFQVTSDGGKINAISGATVTSRAVCRGVSDGSVVYNRVKSDITQRLAKGLNKQE